MAERLFPDFATSDIADIGNGDPNKEPITGAHTTDGWGVEKPALQQMNELQFLQGHFIRGNNNFRLEASGYEAEAGQIIIADNSAGVATIDLPASPVGGQWVRVGGVELFSVNLVTVDGNGNDIMVVADQSVDLDIDNGLFGFFWDSVNSIWKMTLDASLGSV